LSAPSVTPKTLNLHAWEKILIDDPDRDFLLEGIQNGFKIMNLDANPPPADMDNYQSALEAKDIVEQQILHEINEGHYLEVHQKPTIVSALGAIPKPDGGIRLIHDASKPAGHSINDYATLESKITYQTIKDAVQLIKPNSYIAKVDLKSVVYLDDWLIVADDHDSCVHGMSVIISLLRELGFQVAYPKVEGPTQCLTFLGIEIHVELGLLRLPAPKVLDLLQLLREFRTRPRASLRQLQQLAGKLAYASTVVQGGRTFLQALFDLMRPLKRPSHKVLLTPLLTLTGGLNV